MGWRYFSLLLLRTCCKVFSAAKVVHAGGGGGSRTVQATGSESAFLRPGELLALFKDKFSSLLLPLLLPYHNHHHHLGGPSSKNPFRRRLGRGAISKVARRRGVAAHDHASSTTEFSLSGFYSDFETSFCGPPTSTKIHHVVKKKSSYVVWRKKVVLRHFPPA